MGILIWDARKRKLGPLFWDVGKPRKYTVEVSNNVHNAQVRSPIFLCVAFSNLKKNTAEWRKIKEDTYSTYNCRQFYLSMNKPLTNLPHRLFGRLEIYDFLMKKNAVSSHLFSNACLFWFFRIVLSLMDHFIIGISEMLASLPAHIRYEDRDTFSMS